MQCRRPFLYELTTLSTDNSDCINKQPKTNNYTQWEPL